MSLRFVQPEDSPLVPFRMRPLGDAYLLTNALGGYVIVSSEEMQRIAGGDLGAGGPLLERLRERRFLAAEIDPADAVARVRARRRFLDHGPHLHILVPTLRCNQTCTYCHASRADMEATDADMTVETAERALALVFESTSPDLTIEFQGGEPLANFRVVRHVVERALALNRAAGRRLQLALVSNLSLMDEEMLEFLVEHRVQVCTSVDGPAALHNRQRILAGGDSFGRSEDWIRRLNRAYRDRGLDPRLYHVEALLTTTRETLEHAREVVDTYVALGCGAVFLRPMDPFGFARKTGERIGYSPREFVAFYREATDYILELNLAGQEIVERFAAIFLTKILVGEDPNYLDVRSPCGAGIGQVVYGHDGRVFTCDEGRMVHAMGDDTFQIGDVAHSTYREIVGHDTVRAMALASNVDASPGCVDCVYAPYCGLCPVYNYLTQGTLQGRMLENGLCATYMGIQDYLFERLRDGQPEVMAVLERWTRVRERQHFVHLGAER